MHGGGRSEENIDAAVPARLAHRLQTRMGIGGVETRRHHGKWKPKRRAIVKLERLRAQKNGDMV